MTVCTSSFWPDNAFAKAFTSNIFWAANASHDLISPSSFVSFTRSTAVWRSEQEVETTSLSVAQTTHNCNLQVKIQCGLKSHKCMQEHAPLPTMASRACRVQREAARSLAQMFLPSTTPAKRNLSLGNPALLIKSTVCVPRTRSNPIAVTPFKPVTVLRQI